MYSLREMIQYRDWKTDIVVRESFVNYDGIFGKYWGKVISASEFRKHAGFGLNHACFGLSMASYLLCVSLRVG